MSEIYKMWYINSDISIDTTPSGLQTAQGLDVYKDAKLRGKVVFRVDILQALQRVVSKTVMSIPAARNIFWKILSMQVRQPEQIAKALCMFYEQDVTFRLFLGSIYYFEWPDVKVSFYDAIMYFMRVEFDQLTESVVNCLCGQGVKILYQVDGYVYCGINDIDISLRVPENCVMEKVSYAKNWKG